MIGTIGLLIKNAPAILTGVQALTPKKWQGSLNKVRTGAVVAGAVATGASQPWNAESGLTELIRIGLLATTPPEVALPAAPVLATVLTFIGGTLATYVTGYMTQESDAKMANVDGGA